MSFKKRYKLKKKKKKGSDLSLTTYSRSDAHVIVVFGKR